MSEAPTLLEGVAAPTVWQSQSRGPCWWREDFSTLVTSRTTLAAKGAASAALRCKHPAKSSKPKVACNAQPGRWSSPSQQGPRNRLCRAAGAVPLRRAENHTKWGAWRLFAMQAGAAEPACRAAGAALPLGTWSFFALQTGAAGLGLPDRRRSGPLGGQEATRSERPWGPS